MKKIKECSVGIALSGGGARAFMHLGVLQALEEREIHIAALSATSAGAVVAAFYACGYRPKEIVKLLSNANYLWKLKFSITSAGFLRLEKLIPYFEKLMPYHRFEDLKIPLTINATDLRGGKMIYFEKGEIIPPMLASCGLPGAFAPFQYKGYELVDGGVLNNLPIEPLSEKVDYIIGSHCNAMAWDAPINSKKEALVRSFLLAIHQNNVGKLKKCDLVFEPITLRKYGVWAFKSAQAIFDEGYKYAHEELNKIL